jgi:hypothetical protein
MIWGIISTIMLSVGFLIVVVYQCCKRYTDKRQESYTKIPLSPFITPPPAFPLLSLTPSTSPTHSSPGLLHIIVKETEQPSPAHSPPRLPRFVVEEAEPVSKRTHSQTRKKPNLYRRRNRFVKLHSYIYIILFYEK